jgi:hypothetical protein
MKDKLVLVHIRLTHTQVDALRALAKQHKCSAAKIIRLAVSNLLKSVQKDARPAA